MTTRPIAPLPTRPRLAFAGALDNHELPIAAIELRLFANTLATSGRPDAPVRPIK